MKPQWNDWWLELGMLGKLSVNEQREFEKEMAENPGLQVEVKRLQESNLEIVMKYPLEAEWEKIVSRSGEQPGLSWERRSKSKTYQKRLGLALAFSLLLVSGFLLNHLFHSLGVSTILQVRPKGTASAMFISPQFSVFRQKEGKTERLQPRSLVQAGDILQMAYLSGSARFGMIFSIDGNGIVTLHFPEHESDPATLEAGTWVNLANSLQLDEAPGFERFFFVTSVSGMNIPGILLQAHRLGKDPDQARSSDLDLPPAYHQQSILLLKK